jgi:CO dehydrogenase/acetyl-CoA synthase gamma subunit (corrinoid Fe-S protein)
VDVVVGGAVVVVDAGGAGREAVVVAGEWFVGEGTVDETGLVEQAPAATIVNPPTAAAISFRISPTSMVGPD